MLKEFSNKTVYYKNEKMDVIHRDENEGPAVIYKKDGSCAYYKDGVIHRESGPARIYPDSEIYYHNGSIHRLDGPAVVKKDGSKSYYYCGVNFSPSTHEDFEKYVGVIDEEEYEKYECIEDDATWAELVKKMQMKVFE